MSTKAEIAESYDVATDFFELWLDERMVYSCGLFDGIDDLDAAQLAKLQWMHDAARVKPNMRVLDIGCGWGGNIRFLAQERGVKEAVGITLSEAQFAYIQAHPTPGVTAQCVSYLDYAPASPFDAIISIGMFEHIATGEEARGSRSIEIYRDYFRRAWEWSKPGAWFSLQTVLSSQLPRNRDDIRDLAQASAIFPGAITPRIEDIAIAVEPYWEILELYTRREHYARTTDAWLQRLQRQRSQIVARWGLQRFDQYERYLKGSRDSFAKEYISLAQVALRRRDNRGARKSD